MQEPRKEMGLSEQFNVLVGLGQVAAFPATAFLRRPGTWGERYAGPHGLAGVVAMFLFIGSFGDPVALGALYATLAMLAVHRVAGLGRPAETHSLYSGRPWLPGDELKVKGRAEPVLVLLAGLTVQAVSPGLGLWLVISAVGLALTHDHYRLRMAAEVRAIRDARIEGEALRDLYERR
jgi:hypothetical protein